MAYSTSTPPSCINQAIGGGSSIWLYESADAATVVRVAGYITNGDALGMKVGDVVFQTDPVGAAVGHTYVVKSVATGGAADLSDGTAIVTTDTD